MSLRTTATTSSTNHHERNEEDVNPVLPRKSSSLSRISEEGLPFGPINLLVLTDVHSWIAGHARHESNLNMDYGDVLSFYRQLQSLMKRKGRANNSTNENHTETTAQELFLVMNGDFMDGTGLSTTPPKYLTPLLTKMPFSVINLGNHELYHDATVEWLRYEFIPHWRGRYLTSNTLLRDTGRPLGNRYTFLKGEQATLLTFGFLYNFEGNCNSTIVEKVEDVVKQRWFLNVLERKDEYDAILVLAHMHVTDPLVQVILHTIRDQVGKQVPIQFITGHTHIRSWAQLDKYSASFEAGRYLDTLGFCSFPTKTTLSDHSDASSNSTSDDVQATGLGSRVSQQKQLFSHIFLDANRYTLQMTLSHEGGDTSAESPHGLQLTDSIHATQKQLGLNELIGCSPTRYYLGKSMDQEDSLWRLYMHHIVPSVLFGATNADNSLKHPNEPLFIQGTGALRYDLFKGNTVLDDVIAVCPFNDTLYRVGTLDGWQILSGLNITNPRPASISPTEESDNSPVAGLPTWAFSSHGLEVNQSYDLITSQFHLQIMVNLVEKFGGEPIPDPDPFEREALKGGESPSFWTTTELWRAYVKREWKCSASHQQDKVLVQTGGTGHLNTNSGGGAMGVQEEKPLTVAVFIIFIICGLYIYQKRKEHLERTGYIPIGDPTTTLIRTTSTLSYR